MFFLHAQGYSPQCVTSINDPYRAMFRAAVSDSISEVNTNTTASERWTSAEHVLKSAAETNIGNIGKTATTTKRCGIRTHETTPPEKISRDNATQYYTPCDESLAITLRRD